MKIYPLEIFQNFYLWERSKYIEWLLIIFSHWIRYRNFLSKFLWSWSVFDMNIEKYLRSKIRCIDLWLKTATHFPNCVANWSKCTACCTAIPDMSNTDPDESVSNSQLVFSVSKSLLRTRFLWDTLYNIQTKTKSNMAVTSLLGRDSCFLAPWEIRAVRFRYHLVGRLSLIYLIPPTCNWEEHMKGHH